MSNKMKSNYYQIYCISRENDITFNIPIMIIKEDLKSLMFYTITEIQTSELENSSTININSLNLLSIYKISSNELILTVEDNLQETNSFIKFK